MILFITILGLACTILLIVSVIWFRRLTAIVIPAIFLVLFWGSIHLVSYVGYAVDAQFLDGVEATVLDSIDGSDWIYLLVRIDSDKEPRLVRMPNTEQNKKDADAAQQQARRGLTVIRFGANTAAGGAPGAGNQPQGGQRSFRILNLAETSAFGKVAQSGG